VTEDERGTALLDEQASHRATGKAPPV